MRCGTSVAGNYRATCLAQSKAAFVSKLSITLEETDECAFWMEFLLDENLQKKGLVRPLLNEAQELTAMFVAARKTARNRTAEHRKAEE